MVKKRHIFARSHKRTFIGICGNSFILKQLSVFDTFVVCGVRRAAVPDLLVLPVASVADAKLPSAVGLRDNRLYNAAQHINIGVVYRHQYAYQRIFIKFAALLHIENAFVHRAAHKLSRPPALNLGRGVKPAAKHCRGRGQSVIFYKRKNSSDSSHTHSLNEKLAICKVRLGL